MIIADLAQAEAVLVHGQLPARPACSMQQRQAAYICVIEWEHCQAARWQQVLARHDEAMHAGSPCMLLLLLPAGCICIACHQRMHHGSCVMLVSVLRPQELCRQQRSFASSPCCCTCLPFLRLGRQYAAAPAAGAGAGALPLVLVLALLPELRDCILHLAASQPLQQGLHTHLAGVAALPLLPALRRC